MKSEKLYNDFAAKTINEVSKIIGRCPKLELPNSLFKCIKGREEYIFARAKGDRLAAWERCHSRDLHKHFSGNIKSSLINLLDRLERLRVEMLVSTKMPGIFYNLTSLWKNEFKVDDPDKIIALTFDNANNNTKWDCLKELLNPKLREDFLRLLFSNLLYEALFPKFGHVLINRVPDIRANIDLLDRLFSNHTHSELYIYIKKMSNNMGSQRDFSVIAVDMINNLFDEDYDCHENESLLDLDNEQEKGENDTIDDINQNPEDDSFDSEILKEMQNTFSSYDNDPSYNDNNQVPSFEDESGGGYEGVSQDFIPMPAGSSNRKHLVDEEHNVEEKYHVFTKEFDKTVNASSMASMQELDALGKMLEKSVAPFKDIINKLANHLMKVLLAKEKNLWHFSSSSAESGILASEFLSMVVANPSEAPVYRNRSDFMLNDTAITILIDNSGSMRGKPISTAAICTDILSRALEMCRIKVEILGFTTLNWKGGSSYKKWVSMGSSPNPGRLNDILHIIYKSADTPWRVGRKNLSLMLKDGLLKENIDGEALEWAASRLLRRREKRKIIMMISDGAPVDDATISTNKSRLFLDRHLTTVIDKLLSPKSGIELFAIGIGYDVTSYYPRSVVIKDPGEELAEVMTKELLLCLTKNNFHKK